MPKYGNFSGWKAVRTFNRDARVAADRSAYGYKDRYSRASGGDPTTDGCAIAILVLGFLLIFPFVLVYYIFEGIADYLARRSVANPDSTATEAIEDVQPNESVRDLYCTAITRKGARCKNWAKANGRCHVHGGE